MSRKQGRVLGWTKFPAICRKFRTYGKRHPEEKLRTQFALCWFRHQYQNLPGGTMNKSPLNAITEQHVKSYAKDGVTCLRGMFDQEWIDRMRSAADELIADPSKAPLAGPSNSDVFVSASYMCTEEGVWRDFMLNSPLAEMVARTIQSNEIRAYHDHLFVKHIGSPHIMAWHHDMTTWPVDGEQLPTIWVALSNVTESNGRLEFVRGYHKKLLADDVIYIGHYPTGDYGPKDGAECPDFWELNGKDGIEVISWDLAPGDAVIFHPRTPHGSKGAVNATEPRIGLASRWVGDDVVWNFREGQHQIGELEDMPKGEPVRGDMFTLAWKNPDTPFPAVA